MRKKAAGVISTIGHPFVTFPCVVVLLMLSVESPKKALFNSVLIIGCVVLPTLLRNFFKTRNGTYTNFDVSVRTQRISMYLFALPGAVAATLVLVLSKQPQSVYVGAVFGFILLIVSFVVNFFIKCSLHVSLTLYLSFLLIPFNPALGIVFLILSGIIGWSRVELGRHTIREVLVGIAIGSIIGSFMLVCL